MKATKDTIVTITYALSEANAEGEMIQLVEKDDPFEFLFGHENALPQFETHIQDQEVGHKFAFSIASKDAYGERQEEAIVEIPISAFNLEDEAMEKELLQVGKVLPMVGPEGMPMDGLVVEVKPTSVIMDFNHPLSGIDLYFEGEVIGIRKATQQEIDNGGIA